MLGVASSTVSRWEADEKKPEDLDTVLGLAKTLKVDPGWLAFGELSSAPAPPNYESRAPIPKSSGAKKAAGGKRGA